MKKLLILFVLTLFIVTNNELIASERSKARKEQRQSDRKLDSKRKYRTGFDSLTQKEQREIIKKSKEENDKYKFELMMAKRADFIRNHGKVKNPCYDVKRPSIFL